MMIVVDASVVVTALIGSTETGDAARQRLSGEQLTAPALMNIEVAGVIRQVVRKGKLTEQAGKRAMENLIALPVDEVPHTNLLPRVWELKDNVTPTDAAYVAVAESFDIPLVTLDAKLTRATGPKCRFQLL